jgi:hypothetical protein
MFDVFYFGPKPNLFAFEQPADSLEDALSKSRTRYCWYLYGGNDYTDFNFNIVPEHWMSQFVHTWPSQWQRDGGVYLASKDIVNIAYHFRQDQQATRLSNIALWSNTELVTNFDYSWHPDPHEPDYEYHFPTQYQSAGGPVYPGTAGIKLSSDQRATRLTSDTNWSIPEGMTVDKSWHPNPLDPAYTYHFPTKWQSAGGVVYCSDVASNGIKFADIVTEEEPSRENWTIPDDVDQSTIDFTWRPNVLDPPYIYHFPIGNIQSSGLVYSAPEATEVKLMDYFPGHDNNAFKELDVFYVDKNNNLSQSRYKKLLEKYPNMQRIRYANSMLETIRRCVNRSETTRFWVVSSENIYTDFDFDWRPESWQSYMTHVFGSQWNKWSDTFLINKWEFERASKWAKGIEEFPNLNFVKDQQVLVPDDLHAIVYVAWEYGDYGQFELLQKQYPNITRTRFVDNYLDTFKRIINNHEGHDYIWIISSLCDYSKFDFSWQPEPWQSDMIHVFPTGLQKRGDTFYIHVPSFKQQMHDLEILDWFNVINYPKDQCVVRFETPVIEYSGDSIVDAIKQLKFDVAPYEFLVNCNNNVDKQGFLRYQPPPCLWRQKDRAVYSLSEDNATALVPRDVRNIIDSQVYDFSYIEKTENKTLTSPVLDIVFISNGEPDSERWYTALAESIGIDSHTRLKRVENVDGRIAAYQAAARASETEWFFAVFAKLEVKRDFDWAWRPDYFQEAKHYIFHALNPVNGLVYGHQAMIAYNKRLVLETNKSGLDFTLTQAHQVVPIISGTAHYNINPWMTWRTAFREVLKLKQFQEQNPSIENEGRLNSWLSKGNSVENGTWSIRGAHDAVDYYNEVAGDPDKLQLSFEWAWLRDKFSKLVR